MSVLSSSASRVLTAGVISSGVLIPETEILKVEEGKKDFVFSFLTTEEFILLVNSLASRSLV